MNDAKEIEKGDDMENLNEVRRDTFTDQQYRVTDEYVSVDGKVITFKDLFTAMRALKEVQESDGSILGFKGLFSSYAKEHWGTTACMLQELWYASKAVTK